MGVAATVPAPRAAGSGELIHWFGDPGDRRDTVASWRVEALRAAPEGASFLPDTVAAFAAHVMLHGGVFTGGQVDAWLESHDPRWPRGKSEQARCSYRQRFTQSFFTPRFAGRAFAHLLRFPGGAQFGHFWSRPAYRAIGVENSRYRRTVAASLIMQRLLGYDYVLAASGSRLDR